MCVYQVISDGRKWLDSLPREGLHPDKRFDLIIQDACADMKYVTAMPYMVAAAISIGHEGVVHDACAGQESDKHTIRSLSHTHAHTNTIRRPPVLAGNRGGLREIEGPGTCRRRQAAAEHLQRLAPSRPHDAGCLRVSHLTVAL